MRSGGDDSAVLVVVAVLASFVAFLDGSVVNLALPAISEQFGGGLLLQQWVLDGYLLVYLKVDEVIRIIRNEE